MTAPLDVDPEMVDYILSQGYTMPLLGVIVTNTGRMPASIGSHSAKLDSGFGFTRLGADINPPRDHRLEPYSSATWWIDLEPVEQMVNLAAKDPRYNHPQHVRMVVTPGTGKAITTKESIVIVPIWAAGARDRGGPG